MRKEAEDQHYAKRTKGVFFEERLAGIEHTRKGKTIEKDLGAEKRLREARTENRRQ